MNYFTYTDNLTTYVYVQGYSLNWTKYILLSTSNTNSFYNQPEYNLFSNSQRLSSIFPAVSGFLYTNYVIKSQNELVVNVAGLSGDGNYDVIFLNEAGYSKLSDNNALIKSYSLVTQTPSITPTNTQTPSITPTNTQTASVTPTLTQTHTNTPTPSETPTQTPSFTPTKTPTLTPTATPTPTETPSLIESNLVLYFDAANNPGFGTGSWTNLVDNVDWTINGAYSYDPYEGGGSIAFDGLTTYVQIGDTFLDNNASYTMEAWINASNVSESRNIVSSENNPFWIASDTLFGGLGGNYTIVNQPGFPPGLWKYVALTFNETTKTMTLYTKGFGSDTESTATSVSLSFVKEILRVGAHFNGISPVSLFFGKMAVVRIYNTALTNLQIQQNYNFEKVRFGL